MSEINSVVNPALGALSAYQQAQRGTPVGYARALSSGVNTFNQLPSSIRGDLNMGSLNKGAGYLNNVANIYSGIQQGGALGYGNAAANSAQLAGNLLGNTALSTAGGYVAAPLAVYNAINGWESGDTGGDAMRGAAAGASVGSIVPGVGTLIGGLVGGAVGALSSAFGPGKESASHKVWQNLYSGDKLNGIAGSQLPTEPFEESLLGFWQSNQKALDAFTKMDGGGKHGGNAEEFKGWLTNQLADGIASGAIKPGMTSQQIFDQYVTPQMDNYWKQSGSKMTLDSPQWGNTQKHVLTDLVDRVMSGQATSRHDENYKGEGSKYQDQPTLGEALQSRGYAGAIGGSQVQHGALQRALNPKNSSIDYYHYGEAGPENSFFVDSPQAQSQVPGWTPGAYKASAYQAPTPPAPPPGSTGIENLRGLMGGAMGNINPALLQKLAASKKQIPRTPAGPAVMARGGALALSAPGASAAPSASHYVGSRTPSSGRADDIDAKLANNEYVMDAETVSMLGDGNPDEGARRLDQLRARLRAHKGKALSKGKFSPDAKPPEAYLGGQ